MTTNQSINQSINFYSTTITMPRASANGIPNPGQIRVRSSWNSESSSMVHRPRQTGMSVTRSKRCDKMLQYLQTDNPCKPKQDKLIKFPCYYHHHCHPNLNLINFQVTILPVNLYNNLYQMLEKISSVQIIMHEHS